MTSRKKSHMGSMMPESHHERRQRSIRKADAEVTCDTYLKDLIKLSLQRPELSRNALGKFYNQETGRFESVKLENSDG